jgi:flagellin-like protein
MPPADPPRFRQDGRAISPVVGAVLMVAIVVVLAGVFGGIVIGFQDELREPAPSGGFDHEYVASGAGNTDDRPFVTITHEGGPTVDADDIVIQDDSGNTVTWSDVWTGGSEVRAGEYVHIDGFGSDSALDPVCDAGQEYRVIVRNDEGETLLVDEYEVPAPPDLPAGSPSDGDGDGIPDWC